MLSPMTMFKLAGESDHDRVEIAMQLITLGADLAAGLDSFNHIAPTPWVSITVVG